MKILFIYNPNSGDESGEEFIGEVQKYLEGFFEEIILKETKKEGDGTRFVQETKDVDAIGVYGGDGTVNEVLLGMNKVSSKAKLLVLPGGTGNLFAKKLGIDDDKEAALRSFDFTKSKKVDLGKVNENIFSLFASIGAVPEAIHEVSSEEKSKFGGLAYIKKSIEKLASSEEYKLQVKSDAGNYSGPVDHLIVGLTNKIGNIEFTSENEEMDNGKANLFILTKNTIKDRLETLKDSIVGEVEDGENVVHYSVKDVEINSIDGEDVTLDIDGDKGPNLPVKIEILKEAVEVYLPREVQND
ncbi:MAG: diacylglycerol kinase family lipid kinase [Peptoniphilus harei]|nr:diacylglycerol kinase family lipid kinase [Peptoniphilus harei]MDU1663694.1 diacylglycerol kinase family lipid kinase [Peptoniphilus harei]